MKRNNKNEWKMEAIQEGRIQVWVLTRGADTLYCWPRDGKTSFEVAKKRLDELKAKG